MLFEKTKIAGIYKKRLKNGDVSWYGKYRDPQTKKSIRKKIGTTDKDKIKNEKMALSLLNIFLEERKKFNSSSIVEEDFEYKNYLTLLEIFNIYFNNRVGLLQRKLREQYSYLSDDEFTKSMVVKTKLKNQKTELYRFNQNVKPFNISNIPVNKIKKSDINKYIEEDLGSLRISQKTKFCVISAVKTSLNHAIKNDIINIKNPFLHIKFQNPKRQRERVLSKDELKKLLQKSKEMKENLNIYLSIYLAVLTGGRANTILNIRKKDINIDNKYISLYNFKSNKQYKLRLGDEAISWFQNKILPYYDSNEFIIRHCRKGYRQDTPQPMAEIPTKVYKLMDELFNEGLNKKDNYDRDKVVNFHTIRRSIATNLVENGTSVYDVMIFLNHSSVEQTMKYLNTSSEKLNTGVIDLMGNIFKDFND